MTNFSAARTAMVDCQVRPSDVTRYPIIAALQDVPRELYVPTALKEVSYSGDQIELGNGRVLLDPRSFAKMLDALAVSPRDLVLDIGSGLGYSAAVLANMAEAVVAVEEIEDMATEAQDVLSTQSAHNVVVKAGPLVEGAPEHGPYDVIILEGGVETIPEAISAQLKDGGRIGAIFVDGAIGQMKLGTKRGDRLAWRTIFDTVAPVLNGFQVEKGFKL